MLSRHSRREHTTQNSDEEERTIIEENCGVAVPAHVRSLTLPATPGIDGTRGCCNQFTCCVGCGLPHRVSLSKLSCAGGFICVCVSPTSPCLADVTMSCWWHAPLVVGDLDLFFYLKKTRLQFGKRE